MQHIALQLTHTHAHTHTDTIDLRIRWDTELHMETWYTWCLHVWGYRRKLLSFFASQLQNRVDYTFKPLFFSFFLLIFICWLLFCSFSSSAPMLWRRQPLSSAPPTILSLAHVCIPIYTYTGIYKVYTINVYPSLLVLLSLLRPRHEWIFN